VERLVQYLDHDLSQEEEGETRAHVLACGRCETLVLRMDRFGNDDVVAPTLRHLALSFLGRPWFAYSLSAVLLAVLMTRVGQNRRPDPAARPAIVGEALPSFELPQTRGSEESVIRPGRNGRFILRFFVPMGGDRRYLAEIQNSVQQEVLKPVELGHSDVGGNVDLLCRTSAFPSGSYILTVLEEGSVRLQYFFQVQ
jgi:hypothetical protein